MAFNSILFFLFLAPVLVVYYLLPPRLRNLFLVLTSVLFIGYAGIGYTLLVLLLILINYLLALKIESVNQQRTRRILLHVSLLVNLGVLIFFKYWNFLLLNFLDLLRWTQLSSNTPSLPEWVVPIGLSYYTFQTIGYMYDVYRSSISAEKSLLNFGLFTIFFPKLAVGPIERSDGFLQQLKKKIAFNPDNLIEGGKRITWGLFKKLVVADRIGIYEEAIFRNPSDQSGITLFAGSILYTIQVYADFSGYTDIALGTARLFGFNLMENFRQPLFARNLGDFWRRWHISLSTWVNDYIFNPTVFKRRYWGTWGIAYALTISFVVIGIWHGPSWNYVVFGLLHALAMIYEALTRRARKSVARYLVLYNLLSIALTFLFVTFTLMVFRFPYLEDSINLITQLFTNRGPLFIKDPPSITFILIGCAILFLKDYKDSFIKTRLKMTPLKQSAFYALLLIYILVAGVFDGGQFIYFAF